MGGTDISGFFVPDEFEPHLVGEFLGAFFGPFVAYGPAGFGTEHQVLETGEFGNDAVVLADHADVMGDGVGLVFGEEGLTVEFEGAFLGMECAVEDAHEGGFSGSVFTDEGVDSLAFDLEIDLVEGGDGAEFLGNARHFDGEAHVFLASPVRTSKRAAVVSPPRPDF